MNFQIYSLHYRFLVKPKKKDKLFLRKNKGNLPSKIKRTRQENQEPHKGKKAQPPKLLNSRKSEDGAQAATPTGLFGFGRWIIEPESPLMFKWVRLVW